MQMQSHTPGIAVFAQSVGVFDSGVGGLSVLKAMLNHLPAERFQFVADERHLPYGDKPQHEITDRVLTLSNWQRNFEPVAGKTSSRFTKWMC